MVKRSDFVFAKVKGHSPWPAKIIKKVSPNQFKVVFFGTKQEGVVKKIHVWNYEENLDKFSSKYGSRRLYALALEEVNKAKMKKQTKDNPGEVNGTKNKAKMKKRTKAKQEEAYGTKELVFAKVKGHSPWPAQILEKLAPKIYKVFFFGTSQTGKVKKENVWKYDAKCEEFTAKYGGKRHYMVALKQIKEAASLLPSKSTKKKPLAASKTVVRDEASEETVATFVDGEDNNDHPLIIYDSRASKNQIGSSAAVSEVPGTSGTIPEREDEQIEEIQRNDSFIEIKNFSITWTISSTSSRNSF